MQGGKVMKTEIMRNSVSESAFRAACRKALRRAGLEGWIECVNDCGRREGLDIWTGFTDDHDCYEIVREQIGRVQLYCMDREGHGYNFIWEYDPWDKRSGWGYFYCIEF
jgi:hypothetical protein